LHKFKDPAQIEQIDAYWSLYETKKMKYRVYEQTGIDVQKASTGQESYQADKEEYVHDESGFDHFGPR